MECGWNHLKSGWFWMILICFWGWDQRNFTAAGPRPPQVERPHSPLNSQCHIGPLTGHIGPCPWGCMCPEAACSNARDVLTLSLYFFGCGCLWQSTMPCYITKHLLQWEWVSLFFGLQPFVCLHFTAFKAREERRKKKNKGTPNYKICVHNGALHLYLWGSFYM